ncbi:hypothetical protein QBC39DRAFT_34579 [Podospora conica]|nr:hypothetical protein QBC39DRAFT_34579 [Schizothecium conicum]
MLFSAYHGMEIGRGSEASRERLWTRFRYGYAISQSGGLGLCQLMRQEQDEMCRGCRRVLCLTQVREQRAESSRGRSSQVSRIGVGGVMEIRGRAIYPETATNGRSGRDSRGTLGGTGNLTELAKVQWLISARRKGRFISDVDATRLVEVVPSFQAGSPSPPPSLPGLLAPGQSWGRAASPTEARSLIGSTPSGGPPLEQLIQTSCRTGR